MAEYTCHNCVYAVVDAGVWLRWLWAGQTIVPRCANHPWYPGQLHDVTGVPCRNYRPKPPTPQGDAVRMIPLGDGCYAYVDAADYEWLSQWKWHLCGSGYPSRWQNRRRVFMHREIMKPPRGMLVDHKDSNRANNCRFNLRVCTHAENARNRRKYSGSDSKFKGVYWDRRAQVVCKLPIQGQEPSPRLFRRRRSRGRSRLRPSRDRADRRVRQAELPGRMAAATTRGSPSRTSSGTRQAAKRRNASRLAPDARRTTRNAHRNRLTQGRRDAGSGSEKRSPSEPRVTRHGPPPHGSEGRGTRDERRKGSGNKRRRQEDRKERRSYGGVRRALDSATAVGWSGSQMREIAFGVPLRPPLSSFGFFRSRLRGVRSLPRLFSGRRS